MLLLLQGAGIDWLQPARKGARLKMGSGFQELRPLVHVGPANGMRRFISCPYLEMPKSAGRVLIGQASTCGCLNVLWSRIPRPAVEYESMIVDSIEFHSLEIRYVTDVDLESATGLSRNGLNVDLAAYSPIHPTYLKTAVSTGDFNVIHCFIGS